MTVIVEVHSKSGCPHCDTAKAWLKERHIPFIEHSHDDDGERQTFYNIMGLEGKDRTVPQIVAWVTYADNSQEVLRIGGAKELKSSGLDSLFRNNS